MKYLSFGPLTHTAVLAALPQMGWNDWNTFECDVSENLFTSTSQVIADLGLRDLGYQYIVLDDCWSTNRGDDNVIQVNKTKFPDMRQMAEKLHDHGFKFGMYSSAGTKTCAQYPGSLNYEDVDAKTFASFGVDYLKYDNCFNEGEEGTPNLSYQRYDKMAKALKNVNRDIALAMCNWGKDASFTWGAELANSWRMSGDIGPKFHGYQESCPCDDVDYYHCQNTGHTCPIMNILNKYALITQWPGNSSNNGPKGLGAFNDLDMLQVGNGDLTDDENKLHFSMWAAAKSPLMMGNDVRNMSTDTFTVLNNPAVIAVSQDPLGIPAYRVRREYTKPTDNIQGELQLWTGGLYGGDQLVAFLNTDSKSRDMEATLAEVFYHDGKGAVSGKVGQTWDIYDLWGNRMSKNAAKKILHKKDLSSTSKLSQYNSTQNSYEEGLKNNDPALFGRRIGRVRGGGTIRATVPSHGIQMYRLRPT